MKTSSKISAAIFLVLLLSLGAYGISLFKDRNSTPEVKNESSAEQIIQNNETPSDSSAPVEPAVSDNSAVDSPTDVSDENTPDESNNFLDVSKTDCENSCKEFTDPEDLKYCQQICGLTPIKKDIKEKKGCAALSDLEKDYCLKDLAINTKDIQVCTEISDTDVQKTCKNRIAQDLIESQK